MPNRTKKADAWNDTETPAATVDTEIPEATGRKSSSASANGSPACPSGEDIQVDNAIPSQNILKKIEDYPVLDVNGKSIPFKSIYTGPNVARRVLVIFVRHFYCGVSHPTFSSSPSLHKVSPSISPQDQTNLTPRTAKNTSASSPHPSPQTPSSPSPFQHSSP